MELYGIVGKKLSHSFSPAWFKKKFTNLNVEADYLKFELDDVAEFPDLINMQVQLKGLNVTVPYKESIIPFLNDTDPVAKEIGAVNTIQITREGKQAKLTGYNTDAAGFRQAIEAFTKKRHGLNALILGTGGSSKAVAYALAQMDIPFQLVSRSPAKGRLTYNALDETVIGRHLLIVNCTPLGMHPDVHKYPEIPYQFLTPGHLLFDLVYNPDLTQFMAKGMAAGAQVENGLKMLRFQAEASWKIWQCDQ